MRYFFTKPSSWFRKNSVYCWLLILDFFSDLPDANPGFQSKRNTLLTDNAIYWTRSDYEDISDCNEFGYEAIDFNDNIQPRIENQLETKQTTSEENIYVEADIKTCTGYLMNTSTDQIKTLGGNQGVFEGKL